MNDNVKCKDCGVNIAVEGGEAKICPCCGTKLDTDINVLEAQKKPIKKRSPWHTVGSVLWLIVKCIGYLILTLSFMWLIFDIFDTKKK